MTRYDPEATAALIARVPKKYTRGPWETHRYDDPEGMGDINWQVQQAVQPGTVITNVWESDDRNNRADAVLIALAPDLASALALAHAEIARLCGHAEAMATDLDRGLHPASSLARYRLDYPAPVLGRE